MFFTDSIAERTLLQSDPERLSKFDIEYEEKMFIFHYPDRDQSIDVKKVSKLPRTSHSQKILESNPNSVTPRNSATGLLNLGIYCWTLTWQLVFILISHFLL